MALVALVALGAPACSSASTGPPEARRITSPAADDEGTLRGLGSTFAEPMVRAWIDRYTSEAPRLEISYSGDGSPAAVEALKAGQGDFFASETPLSDLEEATLGGSHEFVQVPWAAGAVAIAYNLPDVGQLSLRPDTLAAIFSGRLTRWDDPAIRSDNPDTRLPSLPIQVVVRSDPSGTTQVFSSYLDAAAGASWGLGTGRTIRFPRGQAAAGSAGVVSAVKRLPGAVGYSGLAHARAAGVPVARLGNRAGAFEPPSAPAVSAALDTGTLRLHGTTVRLNFRPDSPGAYPLATVSYLIFPRSGGDPAKDRALRRFASWAMTEGQRLAEQLGYVPVPRQFRVPALTAVERTAPG